MCDNLCSASKVKESDDALLQQLSHENSHLLDASSDGSSTDGTKESAEAIRDILDRKINQVRSMDNEANPEVLHVTTVLQMFQEIKLEVNKVYAATVQQQPIPDKQYDKLKTAIVEEVSTNISNNIEIDNPKLKIDEMKNEIETWKSRTGILTDVCDRMNTQIKDLDQRIENLELNNTKRMVIITGLEAVEKKYMLEYLKEFFSIMMDIQVEIDDYFLLGNADLRPIVVSFPTMNDKKQVMKKKKLLKGATDGDRKIFINDYIPHPVQEKQKRNNQVAEMATEMYGEDKVAYSQAGLTLNGVPYRKKVQPPSPQQLVNVEPQRMDKILRTTLTRGEDVKKDGNTFIAYTTAVRTHSEIHDLYIKLKIIQPAARHIVCAYWVEHPEQYYALDYHDDKEAGAGRILMDHMKLNNMKNRVVFVAR